MTEKSNLFPARLNCSCLGKYSACRYLGKPFSDEQYYVQQQIMLKGEAIRQALHIYQEHDSLYPLLRAEMGRLESAFKAHKMLVPHSPLYAARFREIVDFTLGIGDRLDQTEAEKAITFDRFVTCEMDWEALYISNHWSGVIGNWIEMHIYTIDDDDLLLRGCYFILNSLMREKIYTDFAIQLVRGFSKFNKDDLLAELSSSIKQSGKLLHMNGALMVSDALNLLGILELWLCCYWLWCTQGKRMEKNSLDFR